MVGCRAKLEGFSQPEFREPVQETPTSMPPLASEAKPIATQTTPLSPATKHSYRFNFLDWSSKYSEARQDSARIVAVGFLSGLVVKDAPSVTNKFFTSCAWQNPLRA